MLWYRKDASCSEMDFYRLFLVFLVSFLMENAYPEELEERENRTRMKGRKKEEQQRGRRGRRKGGSIRKAERVNE